MQCNNPSYCIISVIVRHIDSVKPRAGLCVFSVKTTPFRKRVWVPAEFCIHTGPGSYSLLVPRKTMFRQVWKKVLAVYLVPVLYKGELALSYPFPKWAFPCVLGFDDVHHVITGRERQRLCAVSVISHKTVQKHTIFIFYANPSFPANWSLTVVCCVDGDTQTTMMF